MSPFRLLQEQVTRDRHYPWRVMVSCALLNRTQGTQGHLAGSHLFTSWNEPEFFLGWQERHGTALLRRYIEPCGLVNRRVELLQNMTVDYLAGINPYCCRGVGQYARDALDIFCLNRRDVDPEDGHLRPYTEWARVFPHFARIRWDEVGHVRWLSQVRA